MHIEYSLDESTMSQTSSTICINNDHAAFHKPNLELLTSSKLICLILSL